MRAIIKGAEPNNLTTYRAQHNPPGKTAFRDFPDKNELRERLIAEQKGLCCYCMGRIWNDPLRMKIDHWQCQERYQNGRLSYNNLLGACLGRSVSEGDDTRKDKEKLHCDSKKGNHDLKWNPATQSHAIESKIYYLIDGTIKSTDPDFDIQLMAVLNLNIAIMRNNRKAILDTVVLWWKSTPNARQKIQQQIDWRTRDVAEYHPFSPVAVWFLRQKLGTVVP